MGKRFADRCRRLGRHALQKITHVHEYSDWEEPEYSKLYAMSFEQWLLRKCKKCGNIETKDKVIL